MKVINLVKNLFVYFYVFSEMINNVMDHSAAEIANIIIIQDYLKTEVVIIDNGVGIFKKIKRIKGII